MLTMPWDDYPDECEPPGHTYPLYRMPIVECEPDLFLLGRVALQEWQMGSEWRLGPKVRKSERLMK